MNTPARILEISAYPPPSSGWSVRVKHLKEYLEAQGHQCVVLNIGTNRTVPSPEYETVLGAWDYLRKVVRFTRAGFTSHIHVNGRSKKGLVLALVAGAVGVALGRRAFLTFHAGVDQDYFPKGKAPAWAPVFWLLFAMPKAIVCNNEAVKAKIVEYGIEPSRIFPIPAFSVQYLEGARPSLPAKIESFYERYSTVVFSYVRMRPEYYPLELVRAFALVSRDRPDAGLLLCGVSGHANAVLLETVNSTLDSLGLRNRTLLVEDLDHDTFLVALGRSSVYVRTPDTDGVASSVLEACALGVPVVASQNDTRPPGVFTYPAASTEALAARVCAVLDTTFESAGATPVDPAPDTLAIEAALLAGDPVSRAA